MVVGGHQSVYGFRWVRICVWFLVGVNLCMVLGGRQSVYGFMRASICVWF